MTGVHPEVERFNIPGSPLEPRHLVEPAHHVALELRLVLAGRRPAVAPGGGHVLTHRVPVWGQHSLQWAPPITTQHQCTTQLAFTFLL